MTYADLADRWVLRDARYAMRRRFGFYVPVDDAEMTLIRSWRLAEASELTPPANARIAADVARSWIPPRAAR